MDKLSPEGGRKKGLLVLGVLFFVFGIVITVSGVVILYYNSGTDAEGYAMSQVYEVRSPACAFVLHVAPMMKTRFDWLGEDNISHAKWVVKSADGGKQVFAGWAEASDGEGYVSGFSFERPKEYWTYYFDVFVAELDIPSTRIVNQGTPIRPPADEGFWLDFIVTGGTPAAVYWDPTWKESEGMKMLILMNVDGSKGVNADLQMGFKVPILAWLPYLLIPLGIASCIGGYMLFRQGRKA